MPRFAAGVVRFQTEVYPQQQALFEQLAKGQSPEALFITCSDSRIETAMLTQTAPGELFICRNAGNIVPPHTQQTGGMTASIEFAVAVLKVPHIIVCGHYGCSGVRTALERRRVGLADNWLRHVQDVHNKHTAFLPTEMTPQDRSDRLCELNVIEQVVNVCQTTILQDAWDRGQEVTVHSWVYSLEDGLVRDLGLAVSNLDSLAPQLEASLARYQTSATDT